MNTVIKLCESLVGTQGLEFGFCTGAFSDSAAAVVTKSGAVS